MPFQRNADLPESWQNAGYSDGCLTAGRRAANNALDPSTGGGAASDEQAARIFHAVAKRCDGKALDDVEAKALAEWEDPGAPIAGVKAEPGDGAREVKDLPSAEFQVKGESATGYKQLAGYVSAFGNVDDQGDIVDRGAFAKTITERVDAGKVKLLTDHVWSVATTMGTFARAGEDSKGLEFEADLIQRVGWIQDAAEAAAQGHVTGLSIGYETMRRYFEPVADGVEKAARAATRKVRHLAEIKLFEGSLTPFPANELATVSGVKASGRAIVLAKMQLDSLVETLRQGGRHTDPEDRAIVGDAIERLQAFLDDPAGQTAPVIEAAAAPSGAHRKAWAARAATAAHELQRFSDDRYSNRG
jgi:HK97 family phage prohead protease